MKATVMERPVPSLCLWSEKVQAPATPGRSQSWGPKDRCGVSGGPDDPLAATQT